MANRVDKFGWKTLEKQKKALMAKIGQKMAKKETIDIKVLENIDSD